MSQDKAPEWALKAAGEVLDMFVATDAVNLETVALALSQAYERGQESMRERAAGYHDNQAASFERLAIDDLSVSEKLRFDAAAGQHRKVAVAIRSLPIEQEGEE